MLDHGGPLIRIGDLAQSLQMKSSIKGEGGEVEDKAHIKWNETIIIHITLL